MKIQFIALLLCMCTCGWADTAVGKASLSGKVTDDIDKMPLIGVSIYFPELKEGTITNEDGEYAITGLPAISTTIQVSYVGHQTLIRTIDLRTVHRMDFVLKEANAMINEVVVTGLTGTELLKNSPSPVAVVSPRELQATPSTNIIDALAKQPGVSQITTGSGISKPVIRGLGYNRILVVNDGIRQE
jgi:iron complex outermembrane receptor protein